MPDEQNSAQPAGHKAPPSIDEEVSRLFHEHRGVANGDEALNNPELEQLFGSISKGWEQGVQDSSLGVQPAGTLTLEELAASLKQPLAVTEVPVARAERDAVAACSACGSANPIATRFCGMCGHELSKSAGAAAVSGNGTQPDVSPRATAEAAASEPTGSVRKSSRRAVKLACLALYCAILGLVVYQRQLWREPYIAKWISSWPAGLPTQSPVVAESAPTATPAQAAPKAALQMPTIRQPNPPVRRPKTAPPTTVRRTLPGPAGMDSPVPEAAELPAAIDAPDTTAAVAGTTQPAEPAPAQDESTPARPARIKIPQSVAQGALIFKVNPEYPAVARAARVQGSVRMHAIISADGTIQHLQVISGNPLLVGAVLEAVKKWRYQPYLLDGKPAEVETNITVNFAGE
jgi:periplasmic protein TonB